MQIEVSTKEHSSAAMPLTLFTERKEARQIVHDFPVAANQRRPPTERRPRGSPGSLHQEMSPATDAEDANAGDPNKDGVRRDDSGCAAAANSRQSTFLGLHCSPSPRLQKKRSVRLLFDAKRVGGVIGRGGSVISKIRESSGATLLIANAVPHSLFRVCTVEGRYLEIASAIKSVIDKMAEESSRSPPFQITILAEEMNIGCLIGKRGTAIAEIRARTKANIYISGHVLRHSTEKTVDISGQQRSVHLAVEEVVLRLFENPAYSETRCHYDPKVDCPPLPDSATASARGHGQRRPLNNQLKPQLIVTNDCNNNPILSQTLSALIQQREQSPSPSPSAAASVRRQHRTAEHPDCSGKREAFGLPANSVRFQDGRGQRVLPVLSQLIGGVIGRGGRKIQHIRRQSNAEIKIGEPLLDRVTTHFATDRPQQICWRYITIIGTAQQIFTAVAMIRSSLIGCYLIGRPLVAHDRFGKYC